MFFKKKVRIDDLPNLQPIYIGPSFEYDATIIYLDGAVRKIEKIVDFGIFVKVIKINIKGKTIYINPSSIKSIDFDRKPLPKGE